MVAQPAKRNRALTSNPNKRPAIIQATQDSSQCFFSTYTRLVPVRELHARPTPACRRSQKPSPAQSWFRRTGTISHPRLCKKPGKIAVFVGNHRYLSEDMYRPPSSWHCERQSSPASRQRGPRPLRLPVRGPASDEAGGERARQPDPKYHNGQTPDLIFQGYALSDQLLARDDRRSDAWSRPARSWQLKQLRGRGSIVAGRTKLGFLLFVARRLVRCVIAISDADRSDARDLIQSRGELPDICRFTKSG